MYLFSKPELSENTKIRYAQNFRDREKLKKLKDGEIDEITPYARKLSPAAVADIRTRWAQWVKDYVDLKTNKKPAYRHLAKQYDVDWLTIRCIVTGMIWKNPIVMTRTDLDSFGFGDYI